MIEIKNLHISFGEKQVLKGLNLCVPKNSVFGFIGKNGAGKTTTMKAILGFITPDEGNVFVGGEEVVYGGTATNKYIGYLPDVPEFYSFMTGREYLRLCGECLNMSNQEIGVRCDELMSTVGLEGENHRIGGYSRGMKQRLGIAQALFAKPKLLICDEPTSALDPVGRREILELLRSLSQETTVFFSTHILSDVEWVCTDIAILNNGRISLQGSIEEVKCNHENDEFIVKLFDKKGLLMLKNAFSANLCDNDTLKFSGGVTEMQRVMKFIYENKLTVNKIERIQPSLESLFMEAVNK